MLTLTEDLKGSVIYEKTDSRKKEIYFLTVHVKDHESQKLVFGWLTLGSFCRSVWGTAPGPSVHMGNCPRINVVAKQSYKHKNQAHLGSSVVSTLLYVFYCNLLGI